ncbi:class I SAM-dependent methyltransferase [Frankia sp. CNm7]|uniref:Class I SAM-dependent methyltransferase n=1 Tax=Frankia nepalensis TaxID=1836974 RepID=A0A937USI9_9ACTN|nr:class I SAM-dependent methyltransferase [Frankia nepalensis]MBL7498339.1 class I SAM-dependent methyltransferase [Frankia nepalensis]MBL7514987.1 class I SAM-dependent methyltransferase [Frankia nepalensis]MBL7518666.1 class I SAM-dependent methyltransferase [Frankia nepalensis]MBL7628936.1 class I SAM-dependent methyltransferase [Frankia nepalensis]
MAEPENGRWNHNIHYHPLVLRAVPADARRALDVGCGEGMLARALRRTVPRVTGIDLDAPSIDEARRYLGDLDPGDIEYVVGDFLTHPFEPASFDVVTSVAALHHVDAATGLARMRDLLSPGGLLAVIGLARTTLPNDLPRELAAAAVNPWYRSRKGCWEHSSPVVWPPPVTYPQMRALATELLPGSEFRRRLLWRYTLIWRKPQ